MHSIENFFRAYESGAGPEQLEKILAEGQSQEQKAYGAIIDLADKQGLKTQFEEALSTMLDVVFPVLKDVAVNIGGMARVISEKWGAKTPEQERKDAEMRFENSVMGDITKSGLLSKIERAHPDVLAAYEKKLTGRALTTEETEQYKLLRELRENPGKLRDSSLFGLGRVREDVSITALQAMTAGLGSVVAELQAANTRATYAVPQVTLNVEQSPWASQMVQNTFKATSATAAKSAAYKPFIGSPFGGGGL